MQLRQKLYGGPARAPYGRYRRFPGAARCRVLPVVRPAIQGHVIVTIEMIFDAACETIPDEDGVGNAGHFGFIHNPFHQRAVN